MNNPILLSPRSYLCTLIVRDRHSRNHHTGAQETLSLVREEFWIPKGRQCVKTLLKKCVVCRYDSRKAFTYPGPPPLPIERVSFHRPFQHVGVDFTGAIKVKDELGNLHKYYVCLFTCAATRAVHLELINSLSAEAFILCFRRFVARCSMPDKLFSDNGTNFVATNKFFIKLQRDEEVKEYMRDKQLTWTFSSPRSPWQGRMFERMIGIVKDCLHKALHHRQIIDTELVTILAEVESIVNNRPLMYVDSDLNCEETLTPAHMLYGRKLFLYPTFQTHDYEFDDLDNVSTLLAYNNKISRVINKFVHLWSHDYLQSLREKHYLPYPHPIRSPKLDEVVIVRSDRSSLGLYKVRI